MYRASGERETEIPGKRVCLFARNEASYCSAPFGWRLHT